MLVPFNRTGYLISFRLLEVLNAARRAGIILHPVTLQHGFNKWLSRKLLQYEGHLIKVIFCEKTRISRGKEYWYCYKGDLGSAVAVIIQAKASGHRTARFIIPVQDIRKMKVLGIPVDGPSTSGRGRKTKMDYSKYQNAWDNIIKGLDRKSA